MLHTSISIGFGIGSGQYYWILGGFLGIVLTLLKFNVITHQQLRYIDISNMVTRHDIASQCPKIFIRSPGAHNDRSNSEKWAWHEL